MTLEEQGKRRWERPSFDPDTYSHRPCSRCGGISLMEYIVLPLGISPERQEEGLWVPLCLKCLQEEKDAEQRGQA